MDNGRLLKGVTSSGAVLLAVGLILIGLSADVPWRKAIGVALAGLKRLKPIDTPDTDTSKANAHNYFLSH